MRGRPDLLACETAVRNGDEEGFAGLGRALANAPDLFWSLPISEYPALQGPHAPYFHDWVEHTTYDEYWRQWSIERDYSRIVVPAMHIGGWYDVFLSGTVKNFAGLASGAGLPEARASQKLLIGPGAHMPWTPLGD